MLVNKSEIVKRRENAEQLSIVKMSGRGLYYTINLRQLFHGTQRKLERLNTVYLKSLLEFPLNIYFAKIMKFKACLSTHKKTKIHIEINHRNLFLKN